MDPIKPSLLDLSEPKDYFKGAGEDTLPTPRNILLFTRQTRENLQQNAVQNRSHHRFVLSLNFKTRGQIQINHLSHAFSPGQALLIHPYQFHHFTQLDSDRIQWLFCTFELEPGGFLEPLRNCVVTLTSETQKLIKELLEEWHSERHSHELQVVLLHVLTALKRDLQATAADLPIAVPDNLLRKINRLLVEMRGRIVLVADLAKQLDLSESRLRTVFRNTAGISLGSYLQNYRINRAMSLLRTTTLSLADIAEEAGFGSPQTFSRCFKKETGSTPRSYRQNGGGL
ncbi:MAG: helix-turn-helix transcriptional regulator [Akkermansiaceae bacterium]